MGNRSWPESTRYCSQCVIPLSWCQSVSDGWVMAEWLRRWLQQWGRGVSLRFWCYRFNTGIHLMKHGFVQHIMDIWRYFFKSLIKRRLLIDGCEQRSISHKIELWNIFTIQIVTAPPPPIARFMGPTWGPSGADMLAPWTLLSGVL